MNKIVFITGASSGIGYQCAKLFSNENDIVINASRRPVKDKRIINYEVDVSNTSTLSTAINSVIDKYERVDILINCAGYSMAAPIESVLEKDYRYLFDVNLFGALYAIKSVVPIMKKNGYGRIINISSIGGVTPIPYDPYYSSSKAALDMLSFALNTELYPYNVYVTSVLPGGTKTDFSYNRLIYNSNDIRVEKAAEVLEDIEQYGMNPETVAKTILNVSKMRKPPIIIASGLINKIILGSVKFIPKRYIIDISRKIFKCN